MNKLKPYLSFKEQFTINEGELFVQLHTSIHIWKKLNVLIDQEVTNPLRSQVWVEMWT